MPQTRHVEKHFTASENVRDIVIGMSDGLTVPFALAAGLSGAIASSGIVVTAGLAEIAAGAIAMGLGGYLAAKTDVEHYQRELRREHQEVLLVPEEEKKEVRQVFKEFGLTDEEIKPIVKTLSERHHDWVTFMMRFELGIERPDPSRAAVSAFTIGGSYVLGGLIPLSPYFFIANSTLAMYWSIGLTLLSLFLFGFIKGCFTGFRPGKSALQAVIVGGLAAATAFGIAKLVANHHG